MKKYTYNRYKILLRRNQKMKKCSRTRDYPLDGSTIGQSLLVFIQKLS